MEPRTYPHIIHASPEAEREAILAALASWIAQRPGLDPRNYDRSGYQSDSRRITQQRHDANELMAAVSWRSSIGAEQLKEAFRAFSGRLTWRGDGFDYCTGQYWPTEYRAAACAVLRSALWDYWRANVPADVCNKRDAILKAARAELSRGVYLRWFREA